MNHQGMLSTTFMSPLSCSNEEIAVLTRRQRKHDSSQAMSPCIERRHIQSSSWAPCRSCKCTMQAWGRVWLTVLMASLLAGVQQQAVCKRIIGPPFQPNKARALLASSPPSAGCPSILQAAVYRAFYTKGDTSPFSLFNEAVCSLPAGAGNEFQLPLPDSAKPAFVEAGRVLVKDWLDSDADVTELANTFPYKVVRDYHTAVCRNLTVRGKEGAEGGAAAPGCLQAILPACKSAATWLAPATA